MVAGDDDARVEVHQSGDVTAPQDAPLDVALDGEHVAVVEGDVGAQHRPQRGDPDDGVVDAVALPAAGEDDLLALELEARLGQRLRDVVALGISPGPKRSIAHMSTLSELVKTMSLTTLGRATIFAAGKAACSTCRPKWWSG